MGTIPTAPTFTAGSTLAAADLNELRDAIDFWALTPRTYAWQSAAQSTTSGAAALIALQSEVYDIVQSGDTASHDLVTDNSRLYVRTTGKYEINGQVQFATNATGVRTAQIRLNAAGAVGGGSLLVTAQQSPLTGASTSVTMPSIEVALTAGDYIEMFGTQTSGGALNTVVGQGVTFLRMKLTGS